MNTPVDKTLRLDRTQISPKKPSGKPPTLVLALAAGLVAAVLALFILLGNAKKNADSTQAQTPVAEATNASYLVAETDIPARTTVTAAMLASKSVPKDQVPPDAIVTAPEVVGKVTTNPILKGGAVTRGSVADRNNGLGLAFGFPEGMRAVTIALDSLSSVAGFVKPHDHVDVLGTFDVGSGQSVTRTVLQDVELLATGAQVLADHPAPPSGAMGGGGQTAAAPPEDSAKPQEVPNATVLVSPIDAQKLILAASKGKLQLSLRSDGDTAKMPIPVLHSSVITTVAPPPTAIVSRPAPPPVQAPSNYLPPPAPTVLPMPTAMPTTTSITVIRGSDSKSVTVGQ